MNNLSFRFEDGEIKADLFSDEDCIDTVPVLLSDAIALREALDVAIAEAQTAANDDGPEKMQQQVTSRSKRAAIELYAVIKKSSQYRDQQSRAKSGAGIDGLQPFPVTFESVPATYQLERDHSYLVMGNNGNSYRCRDLTFYVRAGEIWVPLS